MIFPTATFAIFFLVVLPLSWLAMSDLRRWRVFIIAASYVFYGWWDWHFVFLLAGCTLWNHVLAVRIDRTAEQRTRKSCSRSRSPATSRCSATSSTTTSSSARPTTWPSRSGSGCRSTTRSIVLPVGISFYTFMAISYVVDTYRRDFKPVTLGKFAAYLSFFPHLVAGPIVRGSELVPQMETRRDPRRVDTSRAFYLIATGLFKKVVIANYLATHITDQVFAVPGSHSSAEILVAIYAYAVQIYADFSGLHRHGDRARAPARVRVPAELRLAVHRHLAAELLAALAHDAVALAARLPLHPARREPERAASAPTST